MKKIGIVMIGILMLAVTACGGGSSPTATTGAPSGSAASSQESGEKQLVIALSHYNIGANSYMTTFEKAFREHGEELGVKVLVADAQGDPMTQLNQVDNFIQQKVDALAVWPADGKAIIPGAKKAQEAGIPIIMSNSNIDQSGFEFIKGYTGPDDAGFAAAAGEMMVEALGGKGKIVQITGLPGYEAGIVRTNSFNEVIHNNSEIEILEAQNGDWSLEKSQQVMENFLTKYKEIDGVFAISDDMAAGAINALEAAGRLDEVVVVSSAFFADGYDNIKAGKQYGSVEQSPIYDGRLSVETAIKIANGEEIEFFNYFDFTKVTQDNLDQYERPSW